MWSLFLAVADVAHVSGVVPSDFVPVTGVHPSGAAPLSGVVVSGVVPVTSVHPSGVVPLSGVVDDVTPCFWHGCF